MRIRTIKPEFFEDESIGALSRDARLLVIGTFLLADDEGLLRWTAPYIKASLFMYDDDLKEARVARLMGEIEQGEFVFPYMGGKTQSRLAWIVKFRVHQRINRPQPGKLPPPSIQNLAVVGAYCRRDDWTCGICGEAISPDPTDWGNKAKPSLDHIVPRSEGGSDYPTNIRIAHLACNAARRDGDVNHSVSDYVRAGVTQSTLEVEGKGKEGNREQGKEGNGREMIAPLARSNGRPRDLVWDVLAECYGTPSDTGRGAMNAAAKTLRNYPADPDEIRSVITALAGTDRDWAVVTPTALAKHWGEREALMAQVRSHSPGSRSIDQAQELERREL